MAPEQSINLDSKSKGGIVGISQREDAVEQWFLTSHERVAFTHSLKEMCGLENYERVGTHKEADAVQMKRDQDNIDWLVSSFTSGLLTNPFEISVNCDISEKISLLHITTGVVLLEQASGRRLDATEMGKSSMEDVISTTITANKINFWDLLPKLKINTFSSAAKKIK